MAISLKERDRRYSAIRKLMRQDNIDCLLVAGRDGYMNRGNIRYITDYGIITGEQYCIFRLDDIPVFLAGKGPAISRLHEAEWPLDFRVTPDPVAQAVEELSQGTANRDGGVAIPGAGAGLERGAIPTQGGRFDSEADRMLWVLRGADAADGHLSARELEHLARDAIQYGGHASRV